MDQKLTVRQSKIIEILTDRARAVSIPELARQLDCSQRTIQREVAALRSTGISITAETGRAGGLTIEQRSRAATAPVKPSTFDARYSPGDVFIGREDESDQLDGSLHAAVSGQGQVFIILGEPGIGKTRLTTEFVSRAMSLGVDAAWGRCRDIEGTPPYLPWTQAIRNLLDARESDFASALQRAAIDPIVSVIPELADLADLKVDDDTGNSGSVGISQFQLFESFTQVLKLAADDRPVLIVLDDLHWADQATLGLLEYVAGEIASTRIIVVGTARTIDPAVAGQLAASLGELARQPGFNRLEMSGLNREEISQLISESPGTPPSNRVTDEVFETTEGNPFFALEISRLYAGGSLLDDPKTSSRPALPQAVQRVIERRLSNLSSDCLTLLQIGSVLGYRFEYEKLKTVAGNDFVHDLLDQMDEALDARAIHEISGPGLAYEFGHALIHRFLYDSLPAGRRLRLHARVAEDLERTYGNSLALHAPELALHFDKAKELLGSERAVKYSKLAGKQAASAFSNVEAIAHYQRAFAAKANGQDDIESGEILFSVGLAQNEIYLPYESVDSLIRAFNIFAANGAIDRAIATASTGISRGAAEAPAQIELCERALALARPGSLAAARVMVEYGAALITVDDFEKSLDVLSSAAGIARQEEDAFLLAHALANTAWTLLYAGRYADVPRFALESLDLAAGIENPRFLPGLGRRIAGFAFSAMGEFDEAKFHTEQLVEFDLTLPKAGLADIDYDTLAAIALAEGRWEEALGLSKKRSLVKPNAPDFGVETTVEFMTVDEHSAITELSQYVADPSRDASDGNFPLYHLNAVELQALMLAVAGLVIDHKPSIDLSIEIANNILNNPRATQEDVTITDAIFAIRAVATGNHNSASDIYPKLIQFRQSWRPPMRLIWGDRLLARLAVTMNDPKLALTHFDESIAFCKKAGAKPELAWTYHDCARFSLDQPGRTNRDNVLKMISDGLEITNSLGMHALRERLEILKDEVIVTGAKPVYPYGLTRREVDVLQLVATGRTNLEIADELVIAENTAATHVANILGKTDSANRAEAATFASIHGLLIDASVE